MDDPTLLLMLSARFLRHPLLSPAKLGVAIEEGVAILSGYATDGSITAVAELVALDMPGVRAVANESRPRRTKPGAMSTAASPRRRAISSMSSHRAA
jgi:osmotically-inducible protein OsmY